MNKSKKTKKTRHPAAAAPASAPPPARWVLNARARTIQVIATALPALLVYGLTMSPTVTLVDSGELILSCATLGVAHPPGFPLYTMLGWLFGWLPLGSAAVRVTWFSAVTAAGAAAVLALIAGELVALTAAPQPRRLFPTRGRGRPEETPPEPKYPLPLFQWLVPPAVGLTFAFSTALWAFAGVAEVYSLNTLLLALVVLLMLRWAGTPAATTGFPVLAAAAVLFGLALGVHHVTVLLTLPAFLTLAWLVRGGRFLQSRPALLAAGAGVAAAVLVYAFLPLAAATPEGLNWGNPVTWQRFFWHVSGKQYQVNLFSGDATVVGREVRNFAGWAFWQLTPLGLAGALAGLAGLWGRHRKLCLFLVLLVLFNVVYAVNYEIAEDKEAYYLPTYLALALALGAGLLQAARWVGGRRRWPATVLAVVVVLLPAWNLVRHWPLCDRHNYSLARDYVENMLRGVGPGGLLLTLDWQFYSPYLYLRHLENFRPDATVVDVNLMRRSWYVEGFLVRQYPDMMRACARESRLFQEDLRLFETGRPYDAGRIQKRFVALIDAMIQFHLPGKEVHLTLPLEEGIGAGLVWVPDGLTMELLPEDAPGAKSFRMPPELNLRGLLDGTMPLDVVALQKIRPYYALMLANNGRYLGLNGRLEAAYDRLELARRLNPRLDRTYEFKGELFLAQGLTQEAATAFQQALRRNPGNLVARQRLQRLQSGAGGRPQ